ncbi:hypothetical protein Efla_004186 [Eimeria flavescens]
MHRQAHGLTHGAGELHGRSMHHLQMTSQLPRMKRGPSSMMTSRWHGSSSLPVLGALIAVALAIMVSVLCVRNTKKLQNPGIVMRRLMTEEGGDAASDSDGSEDQDACPQWLQSQSQEENSSSDGSSSYTSQDELSPPATGEKRGREEAEENLFVGGVSKRRPAAGIPTSELTYGAESSGAASTSLGHGFTAHRLNAESAESFTEGSSNSPSVVFHEYLAISGFGALERMTSAETDEMLLDSLLEDVGGTVYPDSAVVSAALPALSDEAPASGGRQAGEMGETDDVAGGGLVDYASSATYVTSSSSEVDDNFFEVGDGRDELSDGKSEFTSADSQTDTDFSESPPRTPATPDLDASPLAAVMEAVWPIAALSHSGTKLCATSCNYSSMSSAEILGCFYDILPTYEIVETFRQSVVPLNSPLLPAPTPGSNVYSPSPVSDDGGSIYGQSAYTQSPSPSADPQTDTDFSESPPRTPATLDLDASPLGAVTEPVWPIAALSHSGTKLCATSCNYGSMSSTEILSCFYDILPTYEIVVG